MVVALSVKNHGLPHPYETVWIGLDWIQSNPNHPCETVIIGVFTVLASNVNVIFLLHWMESKEKRNIAIQYKISLEIVDL